MSENRFAQVKKSFNPSPEKVRNASKKAGRSANQKTAPNYDKKQRYPFSLHYEVRYDMLEELTKHSNAKSASDYLENLIIREWKKLQRKLDK
ncbi:hypothetical protein StDouc24_02900 [Streptococcus thermophilus]|uniref:hypothetical protein n=1 Tax=Streptococcus thermophilus TaxID=1308 RepID=UPI001C64598F|nr:hypothetical protein [Streptococcus thermophilus]MBW7797532.1 hypothetical protein [Streptococcus thermophilus]